MTPRRRSRFFLSLRQLEQRLAAESKCKRLCALEPDASGDRSVAGDFVGFGEASASDSASPCANSSSLSSVKIQDHIVRLKSDTPESKSFSSSEGHAGVCGIMKVVEEEPLSESNLAALPQEQPGDTIKIDGEIRRTLVSKLERSRGLDIGNAQKTTRTSVEDQGRHTLDDRIVDRRQGKESGITSQTSLLKMQSRIDGHFVKQEIGSVIPATPIGESLCDSLDAADVAYSNSPLLFPSNWNPWEVGRNSNLSESNPLAVFQASPSSSYRVEMPESHRADPVLERQNRECVMYAANEQMDWSEEFSHLCALLNLNSDSLVAPDIATQENDIALTCQHNSDAPAVKHEHPESLFYSKVAKVEKKVCLQKAKALDGWVERLSKSQSEPFCLSVFLIAKASLERSQGSIETESKLTYPRIVEDWLTSSCTPT